MKEQKLPWSKAAVLICTKCGKCIKGAPDHLADVLKNKLKSELKSLGLHKDIRVMTSSCLDICKEGRQAVAIIPTHDSSKAIVKVMDWEEDYPELKKEVINLKDL